MNALTFCGADSAQYSPTLEYPNVRVLDAHGRPVAGAYINFRCLHRLSPGSRSLNIPGGSILQGSYTNRNGLAVGQHGCWLNDSVIVEASAPGFATLLKGFARPDSNFTLVLETGASVIGRVTQNGKPVLNAPVRLLRAERELADRSGDGETLTNARGEYRFDECVPGLRYWVFVPLSAQAVHGVFRAETVTAGSMGSVVRAHDLSARRGWRLAGRIVLPVGASLEGRQVRLRVVRMIGAGNDWSITGGDELFLPVDLDGAFEWRGAPEGKFWMNPYVAGFGLGSTSSALKYRRVDGAAEIDLRRDERDLEFQMLAW